jgi:hypothetical protein
MVDHWLVERSERVVCNMGNEVLLTIQSHSYMPSVSVCLIPKQEIPKFLLLLCLILLLPVTMNIIIDLSNIMYNDLWM